jgi:hypothetical protein
LRRWRTLDGWRAQLTCLVVLLVALWPTGALLDAQETADNGGTATDWLGPLIADPVSAIFTPRTGALVVRTSQLMRSDDSGATFLPVTPPADSDRRFPPVGWVDPTDAAIVYRTGQVAVSAHSLFAASDGLLYKSTDGGTTWRPIIQTANYSNRNMVVGLAVSPADHNWLYVALGQGDSFVPDTLLGSTDGGETWSKFEHQHPDQCYWGINIFQSHPTDPTRLFDSTSCSVGGGRGFSVNQSTDRGTTFQKFWSSGPETARPIRLAGGQGARSTRWYLAAKDDAGAGGSSVQRSDDNGATWSEILAYRGGGRQGTSSPDADPNELNITIAGLVYNPTHPDTLYVARTAFGAAGTEDGSTVVTSGVTVSTDGGATWSDLGSQQMGKVADLALGIDAKNLYLGSDQGLFALPLGR